MVSIRYLYSCLAAEEAAYAASVLGPSLLGIEIGNEPDEYGVSR